MHRGSSLSLASDEEIRALEKAEAIQEEDDESEEEEKEAKDVDNKPMDAGISKAKKDDAQDGEKVTEPKKESTKEMVKDKVESALKTVEEKLEKVKVSDGSKTESKSSE